MNKDMFDDEILSVIGRGVRKFFTEAADSRSAFQIHSWLPLWYQTFFEHTDSLSRYFFR
jgi:hypothetical protein